VIGDHEHDGVHHFLICQPHGGSYQIPDWMFDPATSSLALIPTPRLPITELVLLRALVDRLVAYPSEEGSPGGAAMRKLLRAQMDLFVVPTRSAELTGVERQTAIALLQTLLREAVVTPSGELSSSRKTDSGNE
jgi:hypothetical protein